MVHPAPSYGTAAQAGVTSAASRSFEQPLAALFTISALIYLTIYTLEAPIRFGLLWAGKDYLILTRDLLIFGPLAALLMTQGLRLRMHPAFLIFGVLLAFHGLVFMGTIRSVLGVLYGAKIVVNILFGFFAASALLYPSQRTLKYIMVLWAITIFGVFLDKFGVAFPWAGMKTIVGDIDVDVSKDWMISDPFTRRVAGFARSSICVACLVPVLAIIMVNRLKSQFGRAMVALLSVAAVIFTTQKGAIGAFIPLIAIMFLPLSIRLTTLRLTCLAFIAVAIALPLLTLNAHFNPGDGVFSTESLYMRISDTWPRAFEWIQRHDLMLFGVGLGGLSGPQRFYAPASFNPADNIMILLYAYFGIFALIYVGYAARLATRQIVGDVNHVIPAVAVLAFCFGYGSVLSMIEDQSAALFIGVAIGVLWRHTGKIPVVFPSWRAAPTMNPRRAFTPSG